MRFDKYFINGNALLIEKYIIFYNIKTVFSQ